MMQVSILVIYPYIEKFVKCTSIWFTSCVRKTTTKRCAFLGFIAMFLCEEQIGVPFCVSLQCLCVKNINVCILVRAFVYLCHVCVWRINRFAFLCFFAIFVCLEYKGVPFCVYCPSYVWKNKGVPFCVTQPSFFDMFEGVPFCVS